MLGLLVQTVTSLPPLVYVVIGLATLLYLKTRTSRVPDNIPPFPVRPYPLLGHVPMFKSGLLKPLNDFRKAAGDIYSLYVGSQLFVVMCNLDLLKESFVKQADYLSDRPTTLPFGGLSEKTGKPAGIFGNSGASWKEQRTVSLAILRSFGMGKNWLAEKVNEEVEAYLSELAKLKGEPTNALILTNNSVSNVMCAILIGRRFESDDPYLTRLICLMNEIIRFTNFLSPVEIFPFLNYLPGDLFNKKKSEKNQKDLIEHFSQKFIKELCTEDQRENPNCFINAYFDQMRQKEEAGLSTTLDHENLVMVMTNLFLAGSETTSTTILWAIMFALHFPECQEKINKEIEECIGYERIPNIQDKPNMPYINAFVMETQRLGSIAPLAGPHCCTKTTEIVGYTIPKGTIVLANLDNILKDPKTWGDPLVFRPERFLNKDNKLVVPEEFIPFGIARRICLGESLAKMELFLFITGLFQRFALKPEDEANLPSMEPIVGGTQTTQPFRVRFIEKMDKSEI